MFLINNMLSGDIEMDDGHLIEASEKYLQELKLELENNETRSDSDELEKNDDISRVKKEVERCYENILEEKSKMIKDKMEENNEFLILNQKLTMENDELNFALKNSENNVRHLQKEIFILQDNKSKLMNVITEKEKLHAICEDELCRIRGKLDGCSNDNERMTKHIATLESDLRSKTIEIDDKILCIKHLKDTIGKNREERCAIEKLLKRCQLKLEEDANKTESLNCCCRSKEDEISLLLKKNKQLSMENECKDMVIILQKNKYRDAKSQLKHMKLSLEKCGEPKGEASCVDKCQSIRMKLSSEKCFKPKALSGATKRVEKLAVGSTCCMQTCCKPSCKPSPCPCKPSPPRCQSGPPQCKPSTPFCKSSTCTCTCKTSSCSCKSSPCTCKPGPPSCEPSSPCCESSTCTCKTTMSCKSTTCCCKTIACSCKTNPCTCKPSPPCCKSSTCTCKTITCSCKTNPCTCKPSPPCCKSSTCTCKTITCSCKTNPCTCKPSPPCCKSSTCTCKTITCSCKTNPCTCKTITCSCMTNPCTSKSSQPCCKSSKCTCKTITCSCKTNPCTCKPNASPPCCKTETAGCSSSCEIPSNRCTEITDETRYKNQLQKALGELKDLKSDVQQLSKIK